MRHCQVNTLSVHSANSSAEYYSIPLHLNDVYFESFYRNKFYTFRLKIAAASNHKRLFYQHVNVGCLMDFSIIVSYQ